MIITKLIGGLGNQMFQYAVGRRAAYINNTSLKLDIAGYENQADITPRKYSLDIFNIKEEFVNTNEIRKLKKTASLFSRFMLGNKQSYVKEKHFQFDQNILKIKNNTYLEGYWQSEKYFKDIEIIIRKEFSFKEEVQDKLNKKNISQIVNSNSISIHIRHGDYIFDKGTHERHGVCKLEYYKRAIELIIKKVKNPHFFVFSDDHKWMKQNLILKYPYNYIVNNFGNKDYEDMRLMGLCKHNIIANSSFSWWGAWLNQNKNNIVIAPNKWFKDKSTNTKDLLPQSWIKI